MCRWICVRFLSFLIWTSVMTVQHSAWAAATDNLTTNTDIDYVSKTFSIPLLDGHLVLPDNRYGYYSEDKLDGVAVLAIYWRWTRFVAINNYRLKEPTYDDSFALAQMLMSKNEKRQIVKKYAINRDINVDIEVEYFKGFLESDITEFDQQRFHTYFSEEYIPEKYPRVVDGPIKVVNLKYIKFSRYNLKESSLNIDYVSGNFVDLQNVLISLSSSSTGGFNTSFHDRRWKKALAIGPDAAERIIRRMGNDRSALIAVFGEMTLNAITNPFKADSLKLSFTPALDDLLVPIRLGDLTIDEARERQVVKAADQRAQQQARLNAEKERLAKLDNFPNRNFEIIGLQLGDSIARARRVIEESFAGRIVEFSTPPEGHLPEYLGQECAGGAKEVNNQTTALRLQLQADARIDGRRNLNEKEKALLKKEQARYLESMPPQCVVEIKSSAKLAFTAHVKYSDELEEYIAFYRSVLPIHHDKVVAVVRAFEDQKDQVDLWTKASEKYGTTFVQPNNSIRYWFDSAEFHNYQKKDPPYRQSCLRNWPIPNAGPPAGFHSGNFQKACGVVMGVRKKSLYLADTTALIEARSQIAANFEQQSQTESKPEIKF